jgi:predicted permease
METIFSLLSIYIFIVVGFLAKAIFRDSIDERSLVLISIYFLQPFLILWGFSDVEVDLDIVKAPFIFLSIVFIIFVISLFISKPLFKDRQDRSIFIVTSIIGNTGNLGIPIGLMLFGKESVIYTTLINIVNIFLVYIIGVFFYSLGNYSVKSSLVNVLKLPAIWFVALALILNLSGFKYPSGFELPLKMGAYATMVIQLFIFGAYLKGVEFKSVDWRLFWSVNIFKYLLIPIVALSFLSLIEIERLVYNVILLELIVPIAVMNVNLASLYSCKPQKVAFLTFASSFIFLFFITLFMEFVRL